MATRIMVVLLLAIAVAASSVFEFQGADGMDFYQYWGIAQAQKLSGQELNSPYVNQSRYEEVLNAYADQSSDEHLKLSNRSRRSLQIPQTPLCYALFAWLPANYSLAFGIFQVVQIGLFLAALVILGLGLQGKPFEVLTLTLLLLLTYEPLVSDLKVGNLNSLQLFTLVGLTWMLNRIQASPESSHCLVSCIIFMAGLAFLPLLKPTLVLVALLLAACLWTLKGTAVFIRATLAAAGFSVILAALPCLLFGSFTVWLDWYEYVKFFNSSYANEANLLTLIPQGNLAIVTLAAQFFGIGVFNAVLLMAALLVVSALGALALAASPQSPGPRGIWRALRWNLQDPYLCTAAGVTATLALSPLVWHHYYVLSLFPALWLLAAGNDWRRAALTGGLSILLTSMMALRLWHVLFGLNEWLSYSIVLGLVPLWVGLLVTVAGNRPTSSPDLKLAQIQTDG